MNFFRLCTPQPQTDFFGSEASDQKQNFVPGHTGAHACIDADIALGT